jgi:hypothetical protein
MRIYYDGAPGNTASTDFWVFDARTKRRIGTTLTPGIRKQNTTIMTADVILDTWHDTPVFLVVNRRGEETVLADLPLRTGTHSFLGGYIQIVAFGRGELDASSPLPIGKTFAIKPGTGQPDSEPPDQGYMIARVVPAGIEWDCYPAFSTPYRYTDLEHKKQEIFTGNHSTLIAKVGKRSSALKGQFVHYRFPMETGAIIPSMIRGDDTFLRWPVHLPINFADVTFQLKGKLPQRAIFELPGLPVLPKATKDLFDVPIPFVTVNGAVGMLEVAAAAVEFTLDPTLISKVRIYSPTEVVNTSPRDLIIRYQKLTGIRLLCDPEAKTIRRASWFNWP